MPRGRGLSLAGADKTRVLFAALLMSPHIPLLFMGEEYGETHPFLFFTDFHGDLAKAVREGRAKEFTGHAGHDETVPDPNDVNTFMRSKLDWNKADTEEGRAWLHATRELIALRQRFIVPLLKQRGAVEGNVLQRYDPFLYLPNSVSQRHDLRSRGGPDSVYERPWS